MLTDNGMCCVPNLAKQQRHGTKECDRIFHTWDKSPQPDNPCFDHSNRGDEQILNLPRHRSHPPTMTNRQLGVHPAHRHRGVSVAVGE